MDTKISKSFQYKKRQLHNAIALLINLLRNKLAVKQFINESYSHPKSLLCALALKTHESSASQKVMVEKD